MQASGEEDSTGTDPLDADSDDDFIDDGTEVGPDPNTPRNTDGTGADDALDPDSDGDTISVIHDGGAEKC